MSTPEDDRTLGDGSNPISGPVTEVERSIDRTIDPSDATEGFNPNDTWVGSSPEQPTGDSSPTSSIRGRYRIVKPHSRGALGEVYLARDGELDRAVALKEIQERLSDDPATRKRFVVEALVTGRLEHPGVVPIYGLGSNGDGKPYYVMRFIEGETLRDAIREFHEKASKLSGGERSLELRRLLGRFIDICNVIGFAHSRGVLHRDIKPSNIMLGSFGETIVVDWGLAKVDDASQIESHAFTSGMLSHSGEAVETAMGSAIGTPAYMSPEQARGDGDRIGPASDVFSLGATLHHILVGSPRFANLKILQLIEKVQAGEVESIRAIQPGVPAALEAIALKAMAAAPEERYASPLEIAEDVEHYLADEPVSVYREPFHARAARWSRRHKTTVAIAGALLLASVIGLGVGNVLLGKANQEIEAQRAEAVANARQAEKNYQVARQAIDKAFETISEQRLVNEPGMEKLRADLLQAPLEFYGRFAAERGADPVSQLDLAKILRRLGRLKWSLGDREGCVADTERSLRILRTLEKTEKNPDRRREILQEIIQDGDILLSNYQTVGKVDEMLPTTKWMVESAEQINREYPNDLNAAAEVLDRKSQMAKALRANNQTKEALALATEALHGWEAKGGENVDDDKFQVVGAFILDGLGAIRGSLGDDAGRAEDLSRAVKIQKRLIAKNPQGLDQRNRIASTLNDLAIAYRKLKRNAECAEAFEDAVAITKRLASDFPSYPSLRARHANVLGALSIVRVQEGKLEEAERLNLEAVEYLESAAAAAPDVIFNAKGLAAHEGNLGNYYLGRKKHEEALRWFDRSIAGLEKLKPKLPSNPEIFGMLRNGYWGRADSLDALGRIPEALIALDQAREHATGNVIDEIATSHAVLQARSGDPAQGVREASQLLDKPNLHLDDFGSALKALLKASERLDDSSILAKAETYLRSDRGQSYLSSVGNRKRLLIDASWKPLRDRPGLLDWVLDLGFPADPLELPPPKVPANK